MKCVSINFFCCQKDDKKLHVGPAKAKMLYVGAFKMVSNDIRCKSCGILFTRINKGVTQSNRFVWFRQWILQKQILEIISENELSKIKNLEKTIKKYLHNPLCEFDKETSIFLGSLIGIEFEAKEFLDINNEFLSPQPKEKGIVKD